MKSLFMNILTLIIVVAVLSAAIFGFCCLELHFKKVSKMERELEFYQKTYKVKQGSTALWEGSKGNFLNYELWSFDGGRNWYVIRRDSDNVYIQGNVENVYPGLLKHLTAIDTLYDRVETNGPLNLSNSEYIELLKTVGFEVAN